MPLTLIKEAGTGRADANAYADVADSDAYHEGHLYASAWTAATTERKTAALVMATRVIDAEYEFNGVRVSAVQALQWPRAKCPDADKAGGATFLPADKIPAALVQATCEMARELLIVDRTAAPPGEGVSAVRNADLSETIYSKRDTRPIISHLSQALLGEFGASVGARSGAVKLIRA